jgi:hypothetical protein
VKWEAPDKFQENCSKVNTPFGVGGGPCGLRVGVSPPQISFYYANLPRVAIFVASLLKILNAYTIIPPFVGLDPAGPMQGWATHKYNFTGKPRAPRSKFCLLALAQFSKHTPPLGRVDPAGLGLRWAPTNKILLGKPTPRSNFCLLAPAQFFTLQGISERVTTGGTPRGRCREGVKWGAYAKLIGERLCESGGLHTHTNTHIYI